MTIATIEADAPAMDSREALFERLDSVRSETELAVFLRELALAFGFKQFMILNIPAVGEDRIRSIVALSNAAVDFIEEYDRIGLVRNSPSFATLRRSTVPVIWSRDRFDETRPPEEAAAIGELFDRFGFRTGVLFPVHGPDGTRAAIAFDGDRDRLETSELSQLNLLVTHAFDVYTRLRAPEPKLRHGLTARELEVLGWAANGKTSGEIASILSLSENTVNTYMNAAMRKLDCVNRTQLVAKALRLHLIS